MQLAAGKRDRRIRIERFMVSNNALNEEVKAWAKLADVWAAKTDVSDGERMRSAELSAEISTRFEVLWSAQLADLNPKDRIEYPIASGVYFDIFSVKEVGRRQGFEITATARAD